MADMLNHLETHLLRRELSSSFSYRGDSGYSRRVFGEYEGDRPASWDLAEKYAVGLHTGMDFVLGEDGVDGLEEVERDGRAGRVIGWDVCARAEDLC